jgi:hypothetical protein
MDHTNTPARPSFDSLKRWILLVLVAGGLIVSAVLFVQGQSAQAAAQKAAESRYNAAARRVIDDMQATMVLAEDLNTVHYDVWHQANTQATRRGGIAFLVPYGWMRVVRIDLTSISRDRAETYKRYIVDPMASIIDPDRVMNTLLSDPEYIERGYTLRRQASAVGKDVRALQPVDRASVSYQKIIKMYAYFERYIESTIVGPATYDQLAQLQPQVAAEYMQLYREVRVELP